MAHGKQASKGKRMLKSLPVFGVAGVSGDGGWRISNCADSKCNLARRRTASDGYARRGGNFRRQPGDLLCLRQGKRPIKP
jgi:hypothetical protein